MQELIKIEERDGKQAVSARELYFWLTEDNEYKKFNRWSKTNIVENIYATENKDWQLIENQSSPHGGRKCEDYILLLEFAKKISMASHTKKGEEARDYFIAREKQAIELEKKVNLPNFTDPAEAAIAWAEQYRAAQKALAESTQAKQIAADCQRETLELSGGIADFTTNKLKKGALNVRFDSINIQIKNNVKPKNLGDTYRRIHKALAENLSIQDRLEFQDARNKSEWIRQTSSRIDMFRVAALQTIQSKNLILN